MVAYRYQLLGRHAFLLPTGCLLQYLMHNGDANEHSDFDDNDPFSLSHDEDLVAATLSLDIRNQRKQIRQELTDPYALPCMR